MPGMPAVVIGKTKYAAWSITNNMVDSNDLYVE